MVQSPIFVKVHDLLHWLLPRTAGFRREHRAGLGRRIQERAFDLHEALIAAAKSPEPWDFLTQADCHLAALRGYLRLARELALISPDQYAHAARLGEEVGRLLGAWLRKRKE